MVEDKKTEDEVEPWWKKEYGKRTEDIENLKFKLERSSRQVTLKIKAKKDLLDQLVVQTHSSGDIIHLIVTNINIKSFQFYYGERVKPYETPTGQRKIKEMLT